MNIPVKLPDDITLHDNSVAPRELIHRVVEVARVLNAPYFPDEKGRLFLGNIMQSSENIRKGLSSPTGYGPDFRVYQKLLGWNDDRVEVIGRILINCRKNGIGVIFDSYDYPPAPMVIVNGEQVFKQDCDIMLELANQVLQDSGLLTLMEMKWHGVTASQKKKYPVLSTHNHFFTSFLVQYMDDDGSFALYHEAVR